MGEKLASRDLFEIFLANIHRYTENVFGIYTDCSLFAKFFLTNSFYLYGLPKVFPAKYFPCMVLQSLIQDIVLYRNRFAL